LVNRSVLADTVSSHVVRQQPDSCFVRYLRTIQPVRTSGANWPASKLCSRAKVVPLPSCWPAMIQARFSAINDPSLPTVQIPGSFGSYRPLQPCWSRAGQAKSARTRRTLCGCHRPPVGVAMPRAVSSVAIWRADMPALFNSARIGASCRALSIASAR
jgi:hypothetical protein